MTNRNRWLIGAAAAIGYALLWVGWVAQWSWVTTLDASLLAPAHRYGVAHPGWVLGWRWLSSVFGPWTFQITGAVVAFVALARRQRRTALFLLLAVVSCSLVTDVAKDIAHRARPLTALARETSWSFPSGHALGTIAGALGLCAVFRMAQVAHVRLIEAFCAVVVVFVGVSRVVLNVHNPTDVLAGWLLGGLWFLVWLPLLSPSGSRSRSAIVPKP
ncbi:phosphatase PAP2 family protein [Mycolicibacterium sp. CBMA 226]|uniref:phosphatase PAP2 family protein n=1 Tax=Mycolicibacterium sp. CBMA 226 TaxID=2606611 RepID=UPI001306CCDB|nr:phosphatase PAP2 family protein [Mycolicibacterium sp. CBMA 226]MUL76257.1 phosphatase PAP2 family protein [Mycolicibacterium sp. CBMA 226]